MRNSSNLSQIQAPMGVETVLDLVSLSHALVVADQASFSGAAHILGVRQSAISRRIKALEEKLGVSLFERQPNGVRPTIAGRRFFEQTRTVFADLDNAAQAAMSAGRGVEGVIRVGFLPGMTSGFLGNLLVRYRISHPDVLMEFLEAPSREQIRKVKERSLDVAFVIEEIAGYGCDVLSLWTTTMTVTLPNHHPLAGCEIIEWELLKDEHFIFGQEAIGLGFSRLASDRIARLGGRLSSEGHEISQAAVMKLVSLEFGLSLVGAETASVQYPGVVIRPLSSEERRLNYSVAWLPGIDNPALRRFLSLARSMSTEKPVLKA